MLKTKSVICLSLSLILFLNIGPTILLPEIESPILRAIYRSLGLDITQTFSKLTRDDLISLVSSLATHYDNLMVAAKYLACGTTIRYYMETFTKHFLSVPEGFQEKQTKINKDLKAAIYTRKDDLTKCVKKFETFYESTENSDKEKFNQLWTELKNFEIYYPPEGKYDAIIPVSTPRSEDLKKLLINLSTAKNLDTAWTLWTQDKEAWGEFVKRGPESMSDDNTLLELSLLSGKTLDKFIIVHGLRGSEHNYVIGMIQAGGYIRKNKFVDKKYYHCFWTMYYSDDSNLATLKKSLQKTWNLALESEVVDKFCAKMNTLFILVSTFDVHGTDMKIIPEACQPNSEDYRKYVKKISLIDEDLVPIVEFLVQGKGGPKNVYPS